MATAKYENGQDNPSASGEFEYKQELAYQLVKRLGLAAARQTCIENQWHGVLKAVNSVRPH